MPEHAWIALLLRICFFIGCACPLALLLHRSGLPGGRPAAALAGGILAGILLGPSVAGTLAPDPTDALFLGGQTEYKALFDKDLEHKSARAALAQIGPSPEAMADLLKAQEQGRKPLLDQFNEAQTRTALVSASAMVSLVSLALGLTAWASPKSHSPPVPRSTTATLRESAIAVGIVLFAIIPTVLVLQRLLDPPIRDAVAIGAVIAAGSLFARLPLRWMTCVGRNPLTRRLGLFVAFGAAAALAWAIPPERLAFLLAPAIAVGVGTSLNHVKRPGKRARRFVRRLSLWVCMPACAAYLAREIDGTALLVSWQPLTLVAVAAATAGAGHFIGCYLAIQTIGTDETRAHAAAHDIEFLASGVGLTQLCFAVVLFAALPEAAPSVILAMILTNALAIEIQAPLNRRAISKMISSQG